MSSFVFPAMNRKTGKREEIWVLDDFFGHHIYGYAPRGEEPMTEEEFDKKYEGIEAP